MKEELERIVEIANYRIERLFGGKFEVRQGFVQRLLGRYYLVYKNGTGSEKIFHGDRERIAGEDVFSKEFQALNEYIRREGYNFVLRYVDKDKT